MIFKGIIDKMENKSNDNANWNFDVSSISELVAKLKKEINKNFKKSNSRTNINDRKSLNMSNSLDGTIDLGYLNYPKFVTEREKEESDFLSKYIPDLNKR